MQAMKVEPTDHAQHGIAGQDNQHIVHQGKNRAGRERDIA